MANLIARESSVIVHINVCVIVEFSTLVYTRSVDVAYLLIYHFV